MSQRAGNRSRRERLNTAATEFIVLFIMWLLLSGQYQLKYILLGIASAAIVTFLTNDIVFTIFHHDDTEKKSVWLAFAKFWRFLAYMPWLLYRIIKANIQVASIVLNPKMPVAPAFLQFKTQLKRKVAQVILANSITLTPGTVVVRLEDGIYVVHVLVPESAGDLARARIQNKVGAIFAEKEEPPPEVRWAHSIEELAP